MRNLHEYVKRNGCLSCYSRADEILIAVAEKRLNVAFGPQLREYFLKYGGLSYEAVDFFELTKEDWLDSSVIAETELVREMSKNAEAVDISEYIAICHIEDWGYALADSKDNIYEQPYSGFEKPYPTGKKLDEYIISAFEQEKELRQLFDEWIAFEDFLENQSTIVRWADKNERINGKNITSFLKMNDGYEIEKYISRYGFFSCGDIRLCGFLKSHDRCPDIVIETQKMREKYPQTENMIATELLGKECYIVTDDDGMIWYFDGNKGDLKPTRKSFPMYYLERFEKEEGKMIR